MKLTFRIPTEMYGFVEISTEAHEESDGTTIRGLYEGFVDAFKPKPKSENTLDDRIMNMVVDCLLTGESVRNGVELYEKMSPIQQYAIQTIKRGMKRNGDNGEAVKRVSAIAKEA